MRKFSIIALFLLTAGALLVFAMREGGSAQGSPIRAYSLIDDKLVDLLEPDGSASIVLFWNSECQPCKAEMVRLQNAISEGKIPGGRVKAINVDESLEVVQNFAMSHEYQFQFFATPDSESLKVYKVPGTPTVYHFNKKGKVVWSAAGLVPESIEQAEKLFL